MCIDLEDFYKTLLLLYNYEDLDKNVA